MTRPSSNFTERYRGERAALIRRVPRWARRILVIGQRQAALAGLLKRRGGAAVYLIDADAAQARAAAAVIDGACAGTPGAAALPPDTAPFDAVVWIDPPAPPEIWPALLEPLAPFVAPFGYLFVLLANRAYGLRQTGLEAPAGFGFEQAKQALDAAGWPGYRVWPIEPTEAQDAGSGDPTRAETAIDYLFVCARRGYDPLEHVAALQFDNRPDAAYEVLDFLPRGFLDDDESWVTMAREKLLCIVQWMRRDGLERDLERFREASMLFHEATRRSPLDPQHYQCMAELYRMAGAGHLGTRLLRPLQQIAPSPAVARQLDALPRAPAAAPPPALPEWAPPATLPRVLFVTHPRMHYGLDILYDGLVQALGADRVHEYPWKPSLHGQADPIYRDYPCVLDYPAEPRPLDALLDALRQRAYDFVIWGDCEESLDPAARDALLAAAGNTPVVLVDALDECLPLRDAVEVQCGGFRFAAYFKREFVPGLLYGPKAYPLPFAYPDARIPPYTAEGRTEALFWAGHRASNLRSLYLERVEQRFGFGLNAHYPQEDYRKRILRHRIGLCLFGFGFDTVRYWEIPAHGLLLLAEKMPIVIPNDFQDGVSAVFFEDWHTLEARLDHYLGHPAEAEAIARAGHRHLLRHHTASARARQFLAAVQDAIHPR